MAIMSSQPFMRCSSVNPYILEVKYAKTIVGRYMYEYLGYAFKKTTLALSETWHLRRLLWACFFFAYAECLF